MALVPAGVAFDVSSKAMPWFFAKPIPGGARSRSPSDPPPSPHGDRHGRVLVRGLTTDLEDFPARQLFSCTHNRWQRCPDVRSRPTLTRRFRPGVRPTAALGSGRPAQLPPPPLLPHDHQREEPDSNEDLRTISERYVDVKDRILNVTYGGRGSRPDSKGCDLPTLVEIMMLSPSRKGAAARRLAAVTLCRVLGGDATLATHESEKRVPNGARTVPSSTFVTMFLAPFSTRSAQIYGTNEQ